MGLQDKNSLEAKKESIDIVEVAKRSRFEYLGAVMDQWHTRLYSLDHIVESVLFLLITRGGQVGLNELKTRLMLGLNMRSSQVDRLLGYMVSMGMIKEEEITSEDFEKCVQAGKRRAEKSREKGGVGKSIYEIKRECRKKYPTIMYVEITEQGRHMYVDLVRNIAVAYNGENWEGLSEIVEKARNLIKRFLDHE